MTTFTPKKDITELKLEDIPEGTTKLDLSGCQELISLPENLPASITHLALVGCRKLKSLPENLPAGLEYLDLEGCCELKALPENLPVGLIYLYLIGCKELKSLPENLPVDLIYLYLIGCKELKSLPENLPAGLEYLDLEGCCELKALPKNLPVGLIFFDLNGCINLRSLPENLPAGLEYLDLTRCINLRSLPENLPPKLEFLLLINCINLSKLPKSFPTTLKNLNLENCSNIANNLETIEALINLETRNQGNPFFMLIWPPYLDRSLETTQIRNNITEAYQIYYHDHPDFKDRVAKPDSQYPTYHLIHRYINESVAQRGGLSIIADSALKLSEIIKKNPFLLEVLDESAKNFLQECRCVNQPVAGFIEISNLAEIAIQPDIPSKLAKAKTLFVIKLINEEVKKLAVGEGVEVELGNAMFREVHKQLLASGIITENWQGIPEAIAYEDLITRNLTKENIDKISKAVTKELKTLEDPVKLFNKIVYSHYIDFWAMITVDKDERKRIFEPYVKTVEEFSKIGEEKEGDGGNQGRKRSEEREKRDLDNTKYLIELKSQSLDELIKEAIKITSDYIMSFQKPDLTKESPLSPRRYLDIQPLSSPKGSSLYIEALSLSPRGSSLRTGVSSLRTGVSSLRTGVSSLRTGVSSSNLKESR